VRELMIVNGGTPDRRRDAEVRVASGTWVVPSRTAGSLHSIYLFYEDFYANASKSRKSLDRGIERVRSTWILV